MAVNNLPVVVPQPNLAALAATIRDAHQVVTTAGINIVRIADVMLEHALVAGDALLAAKHTVKQAFGHGHWLKWLRDECGDLSEDRAAVYMRLARNRETLQANSEHARNLSLRGALKLLAASKSTSRSRGSWSRLPRPADVLGWLNTSSITECRCVFDAVGRKRMGQMLPPAWGISLVTAGNIDEIAHLHTRIAALEAEVHERDRAIQKLQRQLGADPDADLDISPFLQRGAAA